MKLIVAMALMSSLAASAAPTSVKVFRCGPNGSIYSQTPCKDGSTVEVADPRSAEQRAAAARAVQVEAAQNDKMARERREKESAAARQGAGHIPYSAAIKAAAPEPAASTAKHKHKKPKPKPRPQ